MTKIKDLHVFELIIKDTYPVVTDEAQASNKLLVHDKEATIVLNDARTTEAFGQVLEYLPSYLRDQVSLTKKYGSASDMSLISFAKTHNLIVPLPDNFIKFLTGSKWKP